MASRPYIDIPFGPFMPDFGGMPNSAEPGYLVDCVGVRPTPNGYRGAPSFADIASAIAIGATATLDGLGASFYNATGSTDNFYFINDDGAIFETRVEGTAAWSNVSPAAGAILSKLGSFIQFGGDVIVVCGLTRAPVKKTLSATEATLFTDLAGSPPIAFTGARVREHVVLGNLSTDHYAVQWCAIGDHEDWPTPGTSDSLAKEAGIQSLPQDLGVVMAVLGGEKFGIILQQYGVTRMTYVGGSEVYEFDTFDRTYGAQGGAFFARPISDNKFWYWMTGLGVFMTDGYSVARLTEGLLDEAIFVNSISHGAAEIATSSSTSSVYDEKRQQVIFACKTATGFKLGYNTAVGRFFLLNDANMTGVFTGYQQGLSATYNVNPSNRKLQKLTNTANTAAIQTGYIEIVPGYNVQVTGAHLLGSSVPASLTLSYKVISSLASADVSQSGFTAFTAPTRGMKSVGRPANSQFFSFRITGTVLESQLIRGIRVYYENAEPAT